MDDWTEQATVGIHGPWHGHRHGPWRGPWRGPMWGHGGRGPCCGPMWGRGGHCLCRGLMGTLMRGPFWFAPYGPRGWYPEMGRRFPFGGGPGPRMFERGYLKYALLDLLQERPKHGYEMMKDLEERMGGFYAPSAGAIYPTLQLLEDRGWATSETVEGKKVYTITDAGRAALSEAAERRGGGPEGGPGFGRGFGPGFGPEFGPEFGPGFGPGGRGPRHEHHEHHGHHHHARPEGPPHGGPWAWGGRGRGGPGFDWRAQPEAHELARQARDLGRLFLMAGRESINRPDRIARLRDIVDRTRSELEAFVGETRSEGATGSEPGSSTGGPSASRGPSGPIEQL